jgi:hypothetical protein
VITPRELLREEIAQVWNIDRSEMINEIYRVGNGILVPQSQHIEFPTFPGWCGLGGGSVVDAGRWGGSADLLAAKHRRQ